MDPMVVCVTSLATALSEMAAWQDGADVIEETGALFVRGKSRFPTPYSNAALFLDEPPSPERALEKSNRVFPDRRYVLWDREAGGGELGRYAAAHGFIPLDELPAMVIDAPLGAAPKSDVVIRPVTNAAELSDFVGASLKAYAEFGLPPKVADSLFARPAAVIASCASLVVAMVDGKPAGGALSIVNVAQGVGGVYWVGTVPAARRRGVGEAVARFVTHAAFERGARRVTLEASRGGEPIYLRMGYRQVGRYARLLSPPLDPT
jgi:ribosomal protein S18 acetylase RimI-like enzyme